MLRRNVVGVFCIGLGLAGCGSDTRDKFDTHSSGCPPLIINEGMATYAYTAVEGGAAEMLSLHVQEDLDGGYLLNVTSASSSVSYSLGACGYANDGNQLPDPVRVILTQGPATQQPVSENGPPSNFASDRPPLNFASIECTEASHLVKNTITKTRDCVISDDPLTISYTQSMHIDSGIKSPNIPLSGLILYTETLGNEPGQSIELTNWLPQQ